MLRNVCVCNCVSACMLACVCVMNLVRVANWEEAVKDRAEWRALIH